MILNYVDLFLLEEANSFKIVFILIQWTRISEEYFFQREFSAHDWKSEMKIDCSVYKKGDDIEKEALTDSFCYRITNMRTLW